MSDYNTEHLARNKRLEEQVAYVQFLCDASGYGPEPVRTILRDIINDHCVLGLDEDVMEPILDAIVDPIRFYGHEMSERGRRYSDISVRQRIADNLGLGKLVIDP